MKRSKPTSASSQKHVLLAASAARFLLLLVLLGCTSVKVDAFLPQSLSSLSTIPAQLPGRRCMHKHMLMHLHRRSASSSNHSGSVVRRASSNIDDSGTDGEASPKSFPPTANTCGRLDDILSRLTSAFPLFVLASAVIATIFPSTLLWVNRGPLISILLSTVMMGTGMTLTADDFAKVGRKYPAAVPAGVMCQFGIMPISAWLIGRRILLRSDTAGLVAGSSSNPASALFLGLILVGCSPGGTASNLVSLIADADVALSVLLTSCSTILAAGLTPLLVKTLVGGGLAVQVSGTALCAATARVVLLPVLAGMVLNAKTPKVTRTLSRFTPFASVLLVALICGGVVAQNAGTLLGLGGASSILPVVGASVLLLHTVGFLAGYVIPRLGLRYSEKTARTISIETGMQNSALAVVLAKSIGADPLACLPGALSATAHSCLGSMLAAYWRHCDSKKEEEKGGGEIE